MKKVWMEAVCLRNNNNVVDKGTVIAGRVLERDVESILNDPSWESKVLEIVPAWYAALELADSPLTFESEIGTRKWRTKP